MHLSKFINFDGGSFWYERSLQFYKSISEGDFEGTFLSQHPGVTVMILSGGSIISATLIKYGTVHSWKHRNELYPYAKLPVVLITGLGIIFIYFLLQKKYSQSAFPLLSAIFLALDPNFLAHSRYFHLDAIVSIFMVLSLLNFLNIL
jgi:dolichyl-phosphate-mannose--protein O-mannosyl transferase